MKEKSPAVITALLSIIQTLMKDRFWGQITIKFKDGEPIVIQQEQQIKLK